MLDIILLIKRFEAIFWPFGNIYHLTPTPSFQGANVLQQANVCQGYILKCFGGGKL